MCNAFLHHALKNFNFKVESENLHLHLHLASFPLVPLCEAVHPGVLPGMLPQAELLARIREIQGDASLSDAEKAQRRQDLMSGKWSAKPSEDNKENSKKADGASAAGACLAPSDRPHLVSCRAHQALRIAEQGGSAAATAWVHGKHPCAAALVCDGLAFQRSCEWIGPSLLWG